MNTSRRLILVSFVFVLVILGCSAGRRANKSSSVDRAPATQAKRKQAIDELISKGVFSKVEGGSVAPVAWVLAVVSLCAFTNRGKGCLSKVLNR
jgi:hypothetical protein